MGKIIFEFLAIKSKELYIDLKISRYINKTWWLANLLRVLLVAIFLICLLSLMLGYFLSIASAIFSHTIKDVNTLLICETMLIFIAIVPYLIIRRFSVPDVLFSCYKLTYVISLEYDIHKRALKTVINWSIALSIFVGAIIYVIMYDIGNIKNQIGETYIIMIFIFSMLIANRYIGYLYKIIDVRVSIMSIVFEIIIILFGNVLVIWREQWVISTFLTIFGLIVFINDSTNKVMPHFRKIYATYNLELSSGISTEIMAAKKKYIKNQRLWRNMSLNYKIKCYISVLSMVALSVFMMWSDLLSYFVNAVISNNIVMNIIKLVFLLGISCLVGYAVIRSIMSNTKSAAVNQQTILKVYYLLNIATIIAMLVILINSIAFDIAVFYIGAGVFLFCQLVNWIIKKKINKVEN